MRKNYIFIILCCFLSLPAFSQSWTLKEPYQLNFKNRHEVSLFAGMASYSGDLNSVTDENLSYLSEVHTAVGLGYTLNVINQLSVSLGYFTTKISGDDANYADRDHLKRNISFTNRIHEFAVRFDYEPFQWQNSKFMPYVLGGVGLVIGNANTDFTSNISSDSWQAKIAQDVQNKKNTSLSIPLGLGIRYYATSNVSIKLEGSFRVGMNDYLDGVSATGKPSADSFGTAGLSIVYGFGQAPSKEKVIQVKPTAPLNQ